MGTEQVKTDANEPSFNPGSAESNGALEVDGEAMALQTVTTDRVDAALTGKERIDLDIDWDSLDKKSLFASMETFDAAENLYPRVPAGKHDGFIIHTAELTTRTGEKLEMKFTKVVSPDSHELQIDLARPSIHEEDSRYPVANFDFLHYKGDQSEEWDMKHRQTWPLYRRQGIAEKIVDLMGEILKERSKFNGLPQSMSCTAIQRDLIEWLKKRGFTPAGQQDIENLKRIEMNDSNLLEISNGGETYIIDLEEMKAKFGGTLPDLNDPRIWDNPGAENPFYHMNIWQSIVFKIKLKKDV